MATVPKPGTAAAYQYNALPVPKPKPAVKPPVVKAADPYGAVPTIAGLTVAQISRMTPQQIALYGASVQSAGPDYSTLPQPNFTKLRTAAVTQADQQVNAQIDPYQAERDRLQSQLAYSQKAATSFAQAFASIAGGGSAAIDDPAAQKYALENYGGSYIGGMAASLGRQLLSQQQSYFNETDAKYAAQIAQIMATKPDLAEKIYESAVNDAADQIKQGKSIADMAFKNKLGAIAALGKAMSDTGSAPTTRTVGGNLMQYNPQTGQWDLAVAGAAGGGRTAKVGGSLYVQNPDGSWRLAIQGPATGETTVKTSIIGGNKVYRTNPDGTRTLIQTLPKTTGVKGTSVGPALVRANTLGSQALQGVYDRIWAKGYTAAGSPPPTLGKDANGNPIPNPKYQAVLVWASGMKTRAFKTAMTKVITSISGQLKPLGYTPEQIKAEAYRIITQVGDPVHHAVITPPPGYKVPKAKNVSYQTPDAAAPAIEAAATQIGKPYQFGSGPDTKTFDCSDLIQWAYGQMGIKLPRDTYGQIKAGTAVKYHSVADLLPGDLIFPEKGHVVMYVGDGKVIAAPHTGTVVQYQDVGMFVPPLAVRRIVAGGTGTV